ncbi:MAG: hypothetical protein U0529_14385 [Thermoanaerobaculia bacterium]
MDLFAQWPARPDPLFVALRDGTHPIQRDVRAHVEELWAIHEPRAHPGFRSGFAQSLHSRYWEMFLSCQLLASGERVTSAAAGPDIALQAGPARVWLEATAPGPGTPGLPDTVPEPEINSERSLPNPDRRAALRYSQAVREKALAQYPRHLAAGIIAASEPYVIALNGGGFPDGRDDHDRTAILHVLFGKGCGMLVFDQTGIVDTFHAFAPTASRSSGATVSTAVFLDPEYSSVSAVLYSSVDVANPGRLTGDDFLLIHNPLARVPVPPAVFLGVRECHLSGNPQAGERATISYRIRQPA